MSKYKYNVKMHLGTGVIAEFDTDDDKDYEALLKRKKDVIDINGTNKKSFIPVDKILALEVKENK